MRECVESILHQDAPSMEILLIDDASTDSSAYIAEQLAKEDARVRVIRLVKNGGQGPARNRGIREAQGRYIAFIDSDDWVNPGYLRKLYDTAERYQADVVSMGDQQFVQAQDGTWQPGRIETTVKKECFLVSEKKQRIIAMINYQLISMIGGKIIRRDLFAGTGLHFERIKSEDIPFSFRLYYEANTFVLLPDNDYCYRQSPESTMRHPTLEKSQEAMRSAIRMQEIVTEYLREMPEIAADETLVWGIRRFFARVGLNFLWLVVSVGLPARQVLASAADVLEKNVPREQAGMMEFLLAAWLEALAKK